jgi:DnaJ-class molecular chaperone
MKACVGCHGKRFVEREKELTIQIQPGMHDGQTLVFPGECSETMDFEEPGDVVLTLRRADGGSSEEEGGWSWRGNDLYTKIRVGFGESVLGFRRKLEGHPSGEPVFVEWRGGPLTHLSVLEAAGKGMPRKGSPGEYGIAYIQVMVEPMPVREWTEAEQATLRELFGVAVMPLEKEASCVQLQRGPVA